MIYVIIVILWILVAQQVKYWKTISELGFRSEIPMLFLRSSHLYTGLVWLLLILTVGAAFLQTFSNPLVQIIIIAISGLIIRGYGTSKALSKYRKILITLRDRSKSMGEDISDYEKDLAKSNRQILKEARDTNQFFNL